MSRYKINPGEFKHPVKIQVKTLGKDEDNVLSGNWETLIDTKAKIINISGKEVVMGDGEANITSKRFIIRYPKHIEIDTYKTQNYRLIHNVPYNIIYFNNIKEANKYLEIVAEVIN